MTDDYKIIFQMFEIEIPGSLSLSLSSTARHKEQNILY